MHKVGEVGQDGLDLRVVPGVDVYKVEIVLRVGRQERPGLVSELGVLEEKWHRVHPEAVHPFLHPEVEDVQHLFYHRRVSVVEIRLLSRKVTFSDYCTQLIPIYSARCDSISSSCAVGQFGVKCKWDVKVSYQAK